MPTSLDLWPLVSPSLWDYWWLWDASNNNSERDRSLLFISLSDTARYLNAVWWMGKYLGSSIREIQNYRHISECVEEWKDVTLPFLLFSFFLSAWSSCFHPSNCQRAKQGSSLWLLNPITLSLLSHFDLRSRDDNLLQLTLTGLLQLWVHPFTLYSSLFLFRGAYDLRWKARHVEKGMSQT